MLNVDVVLSDNYLPLLEPHRHKAYYGGRGTGKSHAFAESLLIQSMAKHERIVGARQFQNSIADSSKGLIENKIKGWGVQQSFKILEREIVHIETDSRFTFIGLERNPESVKSLEGCTKCWVEEAGAIKQQSMDILIPTIRTPGSEIWWSWNPRHFADPVNHYFRGPEVPDNAIIQAVTYEDNPYWFWTTMPSEKALMLRANKQKHDFIWGGGYDDIGESRIFTNTKIGRVDVPEDCQPHFGLDFGYKDDPTALVKIYVLEKTRQIYIAQEAFGHGVAVSDLGELMSTVTESNRYPIIADSSRPDLIDFLSNSEYGYSVFGSRKGPGSIKTGIEYINGYEVVIDPDCVHMQSEATNYCWKVDALSQKILPIPLDQDNHGWDAIRYALEHHRDMHGGIKIFRGGR